MKTMTIIEFIGSFTQPNMAKSPLILEFKNYATIGAAFFVLVTFYWAWIRSFNRRVQNKLFTRATMTLARVRDSLKSIDDLDISTSWCDYRLKFNTSREILAKYLKSRLIFGPSGIYPIYTLSYEITEASVVKRVSKENGFDRLDDTDVSDWLKLVVQTFLQNSHLDEHPPQPDLFDGNPGGSSDPYVFMYNEIVESVRSLVDRCPESLLAYEKRL